MDPQWWPVEVFTRHLLSHGFGQPLWRPESIDREVCLGDVGWFSDGGFNVLFNATQSPNAAEASPERRQLNKRGVPKTFTPLDPKAADIVREDQCIMDYKIASDHVKVVSVKAGGGVSE